ncbi:hypothetical protein GCM10008983_20110 [Lentibacillus halophilus]|uniref:Uncharacterized protein n=1 Tax=Lentibacillus halophilus TaxID=295065 RepID=A0ABN0ZC41_9BACI
MKGLCPPLPVLKMILPCPFYGRICPYKNACDLDESILPYTIRGEKYDIYGCFAASKEKTIGIGVFIIWYRIVFHTKNNNSD